jgi:hypothetical protein
MEISIRTRQGLQNLRGSSGGAHAEIELSKKAFAMTKRRFGRRE